MNRSFSNSLRSNSSHKDKKKIKKNSSNVEFKTIFKTRGDHQLLKNYSSPIENKKSENLQDACSNSQCIQNEKAVQQNIRNYVKNIKKENEIATNQQRPNARQSMWPERFSCDFEGYEPLRSHSQPKLIAKKIGQICSVNTEISDLDQLQKKITQLLQMKLLKKTQNRSFMSMRTYQDQLQKDLSQLITQIRQHQTGKQNCDENFDQQIRQICQKISILEKIIAESFTQSQILKKYYFMKKLSNRSFNISDNKILKQISNQSQIVRHSENKSQFPSMHFSTIARSSFCKPNKQAYMNEGKSKQIYVPNRQNIGRSSYQSEFLNYGGMPTYPRKNDSQVSTFSISQKNKSTYQNDFKQSKIELIDSKDLDCRKDKFRPTKITFMPKKMLEQKQNDEKYKANNKISKKKIMFESNKNIYGPCSSYASFYKQNSSLRQSDWPVSYGMKSEYKSNFLGDKAVIDSLTKDTNLSNLKYEYRRNANA